MQETQAGDVGSIPGSGRPPGGGNSNPVQCSCLENSMCRGAWQATDHEVVKSWTWLSTHTHTHTHTLSHRQTHNTSPWLPGIQIQLSFPSVTLSGEVDALRVNRGQTYPLVQFTPQGLLCPLQVGCVHSPQKGRDFASPTTGGSVYWAGETQTRFQIHSLENGISKTKD